MDIAIALFVNIMHLLINCFALVAVKDIEYIKEIINLQTLK